MPAKVTKDIEARAHELFNEHYEGHDLPGRAHKPADWRSAPDFIKQHYRRLAREEA